MVTAGAAVTVVHRPAPRRANGGVPPLPPHGDGGGRDREPSRRPRPDNVRIAMLVLIGAEVMFFGGLISAFLVLRTSAAAWPPPFQPRLPLEITLVNTAVLLASSVTMMWANRALRAPDVGAAVRRLWITAALGALFLAVQGYEWIRLVSFGLTMSSGTYGTTFYGLIGAHGLHVAIALVWLAATAWLTTVHHGRRLGLLTACAMYWHFVVALWPVLFVAVYL